jgi:hypothetical protein
LEQQNKSQEINAPQSTINDEELLKIFSSGEKIERTPRGSKPPQNNKKKKSKK